MIIGALNAQVRKGTGKGAARSLRRQSLVPAVFYGSAVESVPLMVNPKDLKKLLATGSGENVLFDLTIVNGGAEQSHRVMIKEIQVDPVKRTVLHVDFCLIAMDRKITVEVPIILKGVPAGASDGGILQQVRRTIEVSCLPDQIPDALVLDVSALGVGDSLHVSDLKVPESVELVEEGRLSVATVLAPTKIEEKIESLEVGEEVEEAATESEDEGE
jgi:large subunit ribosomal protein L25